jgi:hypothetical protein
VTAVAVLSFAATVFTKEDVYNVFGGVKIAVGK